MSSARFRYLFVFGLVLLAFTLSAVTSWLLYDQTRSLFRFGVDDRLRTVAAVSAAKFTPEELAAIAGPEAVGTPVYESVVRRLQETRALAEDVRFAYLLRRTDDPDVLEFVADADSLDPTAEIDLNGDGVIDDDDALATPGDPYDVSAFPEFREQAFLRPFVDPDISYDAWGAFLSGHAPVRSDPLDGRPAEYVIGLDMNVTRYEQLLSGMVVPFVGFIAFLLFLLTTLAALLTRFWGLQVRQLEEIDRQKDELLGIVAHQLRNPITATNWSMESILDGDFGPIPGEAAGQLKQVEVKMQGLSELVELLVDVSKIELGRLAMNRSAVDLSQFFEEIVRNIVPQAGAKKVDFVRAVPADLGEGKIDQRLTHMTIENLLSNAVKYTPEGGRVDLTVTLEDRLLTVAVRDTGMGIPKADQGKIFGKLYRASNVLTLDGNGFGLYVARGAIEQQGGTIRFESEEGKGTTFHVTLPIDAA